VRNSLEWCPIPRRRSARLQANPRPREAREW
jgi:hypothetical protein